MANITLEYRFSNDNITILKSNVSQLTLHDILDKLKISLNDFIFYKATRNFKKINKDAFLKFEFANYLLARKSNEKMIDYWLKWLNENNISLVVLNKLPPLKIINKIKIRQ